MNVKPEYFLEVEQPDKNISAMNAIKNKYMDILPEIIPFII